MSRRRYYSTHPLTLINLNSANDGQAGTLSTMKLKTQQIKLPRACSNFFGLITYMSNGSIDRIPLTNSSYDINF